MLFKREQGTGGAGQGRSRKGQGPGPQGNCVCPSCSDKVKHQPGTPCNEMKCPKCGMPMVRE